LDPFPFKSIIKLLDPPHFVRDNAKVVTRNGKRTAALDTGAEMNAGPKELNEGFVRSLPDNGPVVMVNLLRFKRKSADGDGSGWDAYLRYSKAVPRPLKGVGGTILWAGNVEGAAYGDHEAKRWEFGGAGSLPFSEGFSQNGHLSGIRSGQRSSRKRR